MTFAEYTKKRKEEKEKSGGVQETVTSPSKDEKPKSFYEYTRKKKGVVAWQDEEQEINTKISKPSGTAKKYTDFNTESKNAYISAKSKVYGDVTELTAKSNYERKARIEEINKELAELSTARSGLDRAKLYGNVGDAIKKNEARQSELTKELETLKALDDEVNKITITSDLSDEQRNSRIKEIESEIKQLNVDIYGLGLAGAYGNNDEWLKNKSEEAKKKKAELSEELKSLKRVGTFSASELKQFEIDDAKAKKAALPQYNLTARITPSQADSYLETAKAHLNTDKEIETLERQKALYDDIDKYSGVVNDDNFGGQWRANYRSQELSRAASKAINEYIRNPTDENWETALAYHAFAEEYMKNNEKALDDENVQWGWLSKSMAGYLPQFKDQIVPELVGGGVGMALGSLVGAPKAGWNIGAGLGVYSQSFDDIRGSVFLELLSMGLDKETALQLANDEAVRSAAIEGVESAASWAMSGIGGVKNAIGNAAKASVAKGSANAVTKLAANMATKATNKAAASAVKAVSTPLWKTTLKTVGGVIREVGTEYTEEFTQGAVSVATREKAMGIMDKEIGRYGEGNIDLYDRPIYKNADGTISTVDSVTFEVDGKYLILPTIVKDERGNAKRLESDEEVLAHYKQTGEYLGEFETQSEADAYANRLHYAQAYHYSPKSTDTNDGLFLGAGKVIADAVTGKRPEVLSELHEQGKEGAKIGLMMGGSRTVANNIITHYFNAKTVKLQNEVIDTIINDEESLDGLIESGKLSGEGTVSARLAEEVEQAKAEGTVTREQVKQLIESNKVYINAEQQISMSAGSNVQEVSRAVRELDARKERNEPISLEDVKRATGFGEEGSKLVTKLANSEGVTFSQAERAVKTAYMAGFANVDGKNINFENDLQIDAFTAGKKDAIITRLSSKSGKQTLERDLIEQGTPLTDRRNIIQAVTEIEGSLAGTRHSISAVVSGARKITNNLAREISRKAGDVQNLWGLLHTNLKALQSNTISHNRDLISDYSNTYLDAIKNNESGRYDEISAGVQNVSDALTEYLVAGIMPKGVQNQEAFLSAAGDVVDIVRMADEMLGNAREQLYGDKSSFIEKDSLPKENSRDIIETSTGAKVSYSLDDTGLNSQPGVMWTIEEDVLTKKDVALFYREIAKINYGDSKNYQMSSDGEYIFDIENKLIYTDGNYSYPTITKVISFDSVYEDEILFAKEVIFDAEETQSGLEYAFEIVECFKGPGFVAATNFEDSGAYARQVRGRKGTYSRETHRTGETDVAGEQEYISYSFDNVIDEGEVNKNERERSKNLLHDDGSKRKYSKSSGGQARKVDGRSRLYKEGKKAASKRRERCKALKDAGHTRKRVVLGHHCEVIPEKHYDSEMAKLVKENEKNGIDETILVVGGIELPKVDGNEKTKTAKGMFIETADGRKIVVIQCDNEYYSPKQINDHELVHNDYGSERTQRVKNIIFKTLPIRKRYELLGIIQDDYSGMLEDLEGDALEELVANILSGMHSLSNDFLELSKAYWNKDDALIKRWEYEVSKESFAREVEKGYASEMRRINRQLLYDEHVQLKEYIMDANNRHEKLKKVDCTEIGNNFYIWRNKSKTDYEVLFSIPIEENEAFIKFYRNGVNKNDRTTKNIWKMYTSYNAGSRNGLGSGFASKGTVTNGQNGRVFAKESVIDGRGNPGESNRDTPDDKVSSSPSNNDTKIKYALDENGMWEMEHIFENDDPEAEAAMMKNWKVLLEKYGAIPKGENPHRDIQVPQKTAKNKKVSQTVRTILEAKATPDEALPTIEKMVEDGIFSYDVYTDKKAIADAENNLRENGWIKNFNDWMKDVNKGVVSKQHTVMGWALYNNAVNTATTTTSETERKTAMETALTVLDGMIRHQRSAAQALQATRVLKKLSPETQLYGVQKSVSAFQKELTEKYGKKAPNLKINEELAEKFLKAKTEDERLAAEIEIYKDIGRQTPSNYMDKWTAWRYVDMLFNLRTHIRNIVGNAGFAPVVLVKDLTASAIESVVNRVSTKKIVRGKALVTGNKADRALLKAAWGDYDNVADLVMGSGKYNDSDIFANKYIDEGRTIFRFKPVEWARKKNSKLLDIEDMWFSKPHYAYALAQYCKANNITAEQIKKGIAIAPAREYAVKEAQKATYRDANTFSQMVSGWGRNNKNAKGVEKMFDIALEGVLPFRKTPANILVRGVEYSPLGLLKGLSYDIYQVSKGNMSATEAIDNISAGLTGTGLLAFGVLLAAQGLVRGHGEDEEKEKKFNELMGHQAYSLELPNGQSITLDWLAPEALPFFVGVNIWETAKGSGEEVNMSSILEAVTGITEPMLEMSCLQSLNDLFESVGYATSNDTSGLASILSSATTSYLTQGIPTLLGQAERTGEEYRMETYIEKNSFLTNDMQYTLGKISSKIPFWDYHQIPYIDAWGRKEASGTALKRGLNNFINPAYTSTIDESKMEKELLRLYEKTGEDGVFPSRADKYFAVDKKRKDLTAEEYVRYATLKGEKSYKLVSDLVKSSAYKKLSDSEKVKAVQDAYAYADEKAKQAISKHKPEEWVKTADEFGKNVSNFISFRADVAGTKNENGNKISKQEVVDIILDMAQNDSEIWKMYLSMYENQSDKYAYNKGIEGEKYMSFLESLNEVDKPTKSGEYGSYTQQEVYRAIKRLDGLTRQEKAILWQSANTGWKASNNPFR